MKRFIILLSLAVIAGWAMTGCSGQKESKKEYAIELIKSIDGQSYLHCVKADGNVDMNLVDTLAASQPKVNFGLDNFSSENPKAYVLVTPQRLPVYFAPQDGGIRIKQLLVNPEQDSTTSRFVLEAQNLSDDNKILNEYNARIAELSLAEAQLRAQLQNADSVQAIAIFAKAQENKKAFISSIFDLVKNNADKYAAQLLIRLHRMAYLDSVPAFEEIAALIPQDQAVKEMQAVLEGMKIVETGKFADVALPSIDGSILKLSDFAGKGNPVLLDFWASWCPPCRRENPVFRRIYLKYKDKGFDIYAVSLDREAKDWQEAIASDSLVWHHVSNLDPKSCPAASLYKIEAIPSNVLIDGEGNIVGRNLMGEDLEKALDKLFAKK